MDFNLRSQAADVKVLTAQSRYPEVVQRRCKAAQERPSLADLSVNNVRRALCSRLSWLRDVACARCELALASELKRRAASHSAA